MEGALLSVLLALREAPPRRKVARRIKTPLCFQSSSRTTYTLDTSLSIVHYGIQAAKKKSCSFSLPSSELYYLPCTSRLRRKTQTFLPLSTDMHRITNMLRNGARASHLRATWKIGCSKARSYYTPVYQWQDEYVEELEGYSPGGYHPVRIGDEYCQSRYRILHKLGYGSSSTVWLARDSRADRYVSLKISRADDSKENSEWGTLNGLHHQTLVHPGSRFILLPLNNFWIPGPNGNHLCFVSNVLGPTLYDVRDSHEELLPLKIARNVTVQLALALAYMHSRGIVYGG